MSLWTAFPRAVLLIRKGKHLARMLFSATTSALHNKHGQTQSVARQIIMDDDECVRDCLRGGWISTTCVIAPRAFHTKTVTVEDFLSTRTATAALWVNVTPSVAPFSPKSKEHTTCQSLSETTIATYSNGWSSLLCSYRLWHWRRDVMDADLHYQ